MALAKKCDICGRLYSGHYFVTPNVNTIDLCHRDFKNEWDSKSIIYDCCEECMTEILKTIKRLKNEPDEEDEDENE